jgi:hypothetical protein
MRYHFGGEHPAVAQKRAEDEQKVAELVGRGVPAVRTLYDDGGGHGSFHKAMVAASGGDGDSRGAFAFLDARASRNLGDVSRPEALATGPREVPVEAAKGRGREPAKVASAAAAAPAQAAVAAPALETKSFYQRTLSLFGKSDEPAAPVDAMKPAAPAATQPRRGASAAPLLKPQAATPTTERRASLNTPMPGSQPVLPASGSGFARLN